MDIELITRTMKPRRLFRVKLDLKCQSCVSPTEDQTDRKKPSERRSEAGRSTSLTEGTMCDCHFAWDGAALLHSFCLIPFFFFFSFSFFIHLHLFYMCALFVAFLCLMWNTNWIFQVLNFYKLAFWRHQLWFRFFKHQILHNKSLFIS